MEQNQEPTLAQDGILEGLGVSQIEAQPERLPEYLSKALSNIVHAVDGALSGEEENIQTQQSGIFYHSDMVNLTNAKIDLQHALDQLRLEESTIESLVADLRAVAVRLDKHLQAIGYEGISDLIGQSSSQIPELMQACASALHDQILSALAVTVERKLPQDDQAELADQAFADYAFGKGVEVTDTSGWEYSVPGFERSRKVFVETEREDDGPAPRWTLTFTVRFNREDGSLAEAYAIDSNGQIWGSLPGRMEQNQDRKVPECAEFVRRVVDLYVSGQDNAYEAYRHVYGATHEQQTDESDLDYVKRCAEQDWDDAAYQGAVYQEVADAVDADRKLPQDAPDNRSLLERMAHMASVVDERQGALLLEAVRVVAELSKAQVTPRIVIGLEGGIIQGATANVPIEYLVYDYDIEGAGFNEIAVRPALDGGEVEVLDSGVRIPAIDSAIVEKAFVAAEAPPKPSGETASPTM